MEVFQLWWQNAKAKCKIQCNLVKGRSELRGVVSAGTSMLIEDVACPVDKLAEMTVDLGDMFQRYGYKEASCFGHALEGNLHLVFSQVTFSPSSVGSAERVY